MEPTDPAIRYLDKALTCLRVEEMKGVEYIAMPVSATISLLQELRARRLGEWKR